MDGSYYPRPTFRRSKWTSLNGQWLFDFDDSDEGLDSQWNESHEYGMTINVPYAYQSARSGIGDTSRHDTLWYETTFDLAVEDLGEAVELNFNAVDHECRVWVNGVEAGSHKGGYNHFKADITRLCSQGSNKLTMRVVDRPDTAQCRGKQEWTGYNFGCWYTPSSGIWKDVWLTFPGKERIDEILIEPLFREGAFRFEVTLSPNTRLPATLVLSGGPDGQESIKCSHVITAHRSEILVKVAPPHKVDNKHAWQPEHPVLYEFDAKLERDDDLLDSVFTYAGMRTVSTRNGQVLLNYTPLQQRLVLDQGYWKEGLLTATPEELEEDLRLVKEMGFNGVRMHQKIESPWFYYLADRMGLLVWGEIPSPYEFCLDEIGNLAETALATVRELYNHPSIITWVPLNESWGVRDILFNTRMQQLSNALYHLLKSCDRNRLVSGNDGWEQTESDICAIHDYLAHDKPSWNLAWSDKDKVEKRTVSHRQSYAEGYSRDGAPILLTEFGGIALAKDVKDGAWGYRGPAKDEGELEKRISSIMEAVTQDTEVVGWCYTQLTDVMQEVNGLLDEDHKPKLPTETYRKLFNP